VNKNVTFSFLLEKFVMSQNSSRSLKTIQDRYL